MEELDFPAGGPQPKMWFSPDSLDALMLEMLQALRAAKYETQGWKSKVECAEKSFHAWMRAGGGRVFENPETNLLSKINPGPQREPPKRQS